MQLIKLSAAWCSPCRSVSESLKSVDLSGIELIEFDIDETPEAASAYLVRGVPTLILMKDGEELSRKVGALNSPQINHWLGGFKE